MGTEGFKFQVSSCKDKTNSAQDAGEPQARCLRSRKEADGGRQEADGRRRKADGRRQMAGGSTLKA